MGCFEGTACILSIVKQITSPGGMHETSARAWCTGKTQRDQVEWEVGGGIEMGNTCISMADSCQCIAKTTKKKIIINEIKKKNNHTRFALCHWVRPCLEELFLLN